MHHDSRPGETKRRLTQRLFDERETVVTLVAVFADVETFFFFLGRDADPHHGLEYDPGDRCHDKHVAATGHDADQLVNELFAATAVEQAGLLRGISAAGDSIGLSKQAHAQRAEHAIQQVHRGGAHRVVSVNVSLSVRCLRR